jgi:hypothetical protein
MFVQFLIFFADMVYQIKVARPKVVENWRSVQRIIGQDDQPVWNSDER